VRLISLILVTSRVQELITDFLGMPSVYSEAQGSAGGTQYAVIHSM
jgi:hypothetical protein